MERLYRQAAERPDAIAVVYGDERIALRASWSSGSSGSRTASPTAASAPATRSALVLRDDPWFVTAFYAVTALGGDRRAGQPGVQADRDRLLASAAPA